MMHEDWAFTDDLADGLGPEAIVLLRDPDSGTRAAVVVDNTACGPAIGGLRMEPDVTVTEVARLARAMTLKSAAAGVAHGGAKAGLMADPALPSRDKENLLRWFARAIRDVRAYIPGPDMGTDELCMAWIHDEIGRSVGLPAVLGGIPLDELGATGFGLAVAAEAAADALEGFTLKGARVALEGFGAVGEHAARFLAERGAVVVAISDRGGSVSDPSGLPVDELAAVKAAGRSVAAFGGGRAGPREALLTVDCDILVPAARPDAVTESNVDGVTARLVLEGANIPVTPKAEAVLHERGVVCLPDWIVNAGGLICAAVEYDGGTRAEAFERIETRISANTSAMLERALREDRMPRAVAEETALAQVTEAMALRRRFGIQERPGP
jgi:glutamate dehydrogenase/leucine dehydrogenase